MSTSSAAELGHGPYVVMNDVTLCHGDLSASAIQPEHIEAVRQWRNSQMGVLRQSREITESMQRSYFETHVWPEKKLKDPGKILLIVEEADVLIGYGGLVHINWDYRRAEISFLLNPERAATDEASAPVFSVFLHIVERLAFECLGLERLSTETYATRIPYIAALERHGFLCEGRLRSHVQIDGQAVDALLHGRLKHEVATSK
ncbi:MAG: GNAT family N-acetyltransferase [Roseobacter sp.]